MWKFSNCFQMSSVLSSFRKQPLDIFFFVFVIIQIESRRAEPVFSQNVVYRPAAPDPLVSLLTHRFSVPVSGRLIGISVRRALEINILGCSPKILMFTKVQEALP